MEERKKMREEEKNEGEIFSLESENFFLQTDLFCNCEETETSSFFFEWLMKS